MTSHCKSLASSAKVADIKGMEVPDEAQGKSCGARRRNPNNKLGIIICCIYDSYSGKELNMEIFFLISEILPFSSTICNN
jgi:hypothetical protein